jgi:fused signal recognition particle receptor
MAGIWERFRAGLARTREQLGDRLRTVWSSGREGVDWDQLEEVLYQADLGVESVEALLAAVRARRPGDAPTALAAIRETMLAWLGPAEDPWQLGAVRPEVWILVGVNGTGKTTTAAKMAFGLKQRGYRPLLGAADTFRAAATEQLKAWGQRVEVEVIAQPPGADPGAVAFDTVQAARARQLDVAIIDTAGRLHNRANLMQELEKVVRVVKREPPVAVRGWLVLDATTGQNGLQQARVFTQHVEVSGIVLTKLDGTAKGGIALAIARELGIPVRWVGLGERLDDLLPFDPAAYVAAILG